MNHSIFILSHQDDEICVFENIRLAVEFKRKIKIFFMTNGYLKTKVSKYSISKRDEESLTVLKKLGVKKKDIIFFGRENNIPSCRLFKNLDFSFKFLFNYLKNLKGKIEIFTHAYEGGNEDHDACNIITLKIIRNFNKNIYAFQFSFYNADTKLFPYKVQKPLKIHGNLLKVDMKFSDRLLYLKYLFEYKSQLKVWFGLYPFLVFNLLFRNYYFLQKINKNFKVIKPHKGRLLYEKFRNSRFETLRFNFIKFLN